MLQNAAVVVAVVDAVAVLKLDATPGRATMIRLRNKAKPNNFNRPLLSHLPRGQCMLWARYSSQLIRKARKMSTHAPFTPPFPVPKGYKPHTERTTTILLQDDNTAFLNPVQEFNRDLSVAVIRGWNQKRKEAMKTRWEDNKTFREAKEKRKAEKAARRLNHWNSTDISCQGVYL